MTLGQIVALADAEVRMHEPKKRGRGREGSFADLRALSAMRLQS